MKNSGFSYFCNSLHLFLRPHTDTFLQKYDDSSNFATLTLFRKTLLA